jgi:RimJ/RimL family protein N-acetyltransferase
MLDERPPAARSATAPDEIRTERLLLRRWHPDDAAALQLLLEANAPRLRPWIPARIAEPAPIDQLTKRLTEFAVAFDAGREWRYAIVTLEGAQLLGELSVFARGPSGRVHIDEADHLEIGYWMRADYTGRGLVTEATRAVLELAPRMWQLSRVAIHCDVRNTDSSAIPRRLGFALVAHAEEKSGKASEPRLQIWEKLL